MGCSCRQSCGLELRGQFRHRAAQHGPRRDRRLPHRKSSRDSPNKKRGYCGCDGGQQAPGFPGQQPLQLTTDHRQDLMRPAPGTSDRIRIRLLPPPGATVFSASGATASDSSSAARTYRSTCRLRISSAKSWAFSVTPNICPCGFRQLVGLVYDDGRAVRQDGLFLLAAVDEVRQQEVVVADLDRVLPALAGVQETAVPAVLPPAITPLGDTDPLPVVTAHPGQLVQIQHMPGGCAGLGGRRGFLWLPST